MIYWLTYAVVKLILKLLCSPQVVGRENIPRKGAFILASNHQSNIDPFLLGTFSGRALNFMAKDSLFKNKVSAWLFNQWGTFPIKRDESDFKAIRETIRRLEKGIPILVFPEGTRGAQGRDKKIQAGIGLLAAKTKAPIIPVYIENSQQVLPPGSKFPKRHPVTLTFGPPVSFHPHQSYPDIAQQVVEKIYLLKS